MANGDGWDSVDGAAGTYYRRGMWELEYVSAPGRAGYWAIRDAGGNRPRAGECRNDRLAPHQDIAAQRWANRQLRLDGLR